MIEVDLYTALHSLAGGRVFWGVAPQGTAAPRIVLTKISGQRDWAMAGPTGARRHAVQVDCYATTPLAALELSEQVFDTLTTAGLPFGVGPATDLPSDFDNTAGLHRASVEYQIQT